MARFVFAFLILWLPLVAWAQWPVAVADYQFGTSQTHGQGPGFFPANVLGPLTAPYTPTAPAVGEDQVVSLGKGGYIVLEFSPVIIDGPSADFIVFENPILVPQNGFIFAEWMIVAVSEDGITWQTFPHDTATGDGMAGRTPTAPYGTPLQNPDSAGGDAFDLAAVGLAQARYVRVTDATQYQTADRLSADLDGIVAVHTAVGAHLAQPVPPLRAWANGQTVYVAAIENQPIEWHCSDVAGRLTATGTVAAGAGAVRPFSLPDMPSGVYFVELTSGAFRNCLRVWVNQ